MSKNKVLDKVLSGANDSNIRFHDLRKLLLEYGFYERIKGDHYIFTKDNVDEIVNLQPLKDDKAKSYQVRQVRNLFLKYKVHLEKGN
jgi:predicted RNA binding protein YcfA (HicA-like mRNA interferase family)